MANVTNLLSLGGVATAAIAYIGGVLTKPLQDHFAFMRRKHDLRVCLYSEIGTVCSRYVRFAYHSPLEVRVQCPNDAFKLAMTIPEVFYALEEKHFFEGVYRVMLNYERKPRRTKLARQVMAYIDEAILLGRLNRRLLWKHCDIEGREHIDLLPKKRFTPVEFEKELERFDGAA